MTEREELIKLLTDCHKVLSAMYFGGNPHKDLLDRIQSAIKSQPVPVEPVMLAAMRPVGNAPELIKYIDSMQSRVIVNLLEEK